MDAFSAPNSVTQTLDHASWRFRRVDRRRWLPAVVPGCVHTDLARAKKIPDVFFGCNEQKAQWIDEHEWIYATDFILSEDAWAHEEIELVAEGLDTIATVLLNGKEIGRSENMFVAHRWPAKAHLLRAKPNRLEVHFASPTKYVETRRQNHRPREINDPVGGCTRIRKQQCAFGWDWGPRLVTSGIWKSLHVQAWSVNRFTSVRIVQRHSAGEVSLRCLPQLAKGHNARLRFHLRIDLDGQRVADSDELTLVVPSPQLWWPSGQGPQPLYSIRVECWQEDRLIDVWARRIGLRTVEAEQKADRWGKSFHFNVNGRPVFAKGSNWIPAHVFTAGLGRKDYEPLLRAAAAAHMNMIRVWGGGIYEHDAFYDLCDELGLLVWQDFMFACTLYPADRAFLDSVREEARQQVQRLRHHASLALWCGNNEIESLNLDALRASKQSRRHYERLFTELLPQVVADQDGATPYWPSSPAGSQNEGVSKDAEHLNGDWHDWDVWHARQPVKAYEKSHARFVSEFGMQSFSSPAVAATFSRPHDWNILSPVMENRQKNPSGNAIILDYVLRRYRYPGDYTSLAYLSQLNQAYCMKVAVEHWRRSRPRTMGALYWQLNDCWPAISWSSIEFGGRWKPLHYAAKRFFAPILVSAHVHGDEWRGIGNRLKNDIHRVDLFTVSDHPTRVSALLSWELWHLSGKKIIRQARQVSLSYGKATLRAKLDFASEIAEYGRAHLFLRIRLVAKSLPVSEDIVLFTAPRHLELKPAQVNVNLENSGAGLWRLRLRSSGFHHGLVLDFPGIAFTADDNCFDMIPGLDRHVLINVPEVRNARQLKDAIVIQSLADFYSPPHEAS